MEARKLSALIDEFKDQSEDNSVELEIRLKNITRDVFSAVIDSIDEKIMAGTLPPGNLTSTVNIIANNILGANDRSQSIWQIKYDGDVSSSTYMRKERLKNVQLSGYIPYSVGLAIERDIGKFPLPTDALVRFKLRSEIQLSPQWRLDITAVRSGTLKNMSTELKTVRKRLFGSVKSLKDLNHEEVNQYEIEIEYTGNPGEITIADFDIISELFALINSQYADEIKYQDEIYDIAKLIAYNPDRFKRPQYRLKQLTNQAISLSLSQYREIAPPIGYYLTDKADGKRVLISIRGFECMIIASDGLQTHRMEAGEDATSDFRLVADCEEVMINDKKSKKVTSTTHYYIFDVLVYNEVLTDKPLSDRVEKINLAVETISKYIKFDRIHAKSYTRLEKDNLKSAFTDLRDKAASYPRDGYIISTGDTSYYNTINYKWKPYEMNTIDFLAVKCPDKLLGQIPYVVVPGCTLYLLFVGINRTMKDKLGLGLIAHYHSIFPSMGEYFPIQFSPSANPLAYIYYSKDSSSNIDGQIIELSRNADNTNWVFHKIRSDRKLEKNYYGNDFKIAELTYMNYIDVFTFEHLYAPESSYFTKTADNSYFASNKYKRFVISLLLKENLTNSKYVIDLAAGRGADLHRYKEIGVSTALFIDVDKSAIAELIRRKFTMFNRKKKFTKGNNWFKDGNVSGGGSGGGSGSTDTCLPPKVTKISFDKIMLKDTQTMTVHTLVRDLTQNHIETIEMMAKYGLSEGTIDGMVCNFAIHYFCDSIDHIRNVIKLVSKMLRVQGLFIFTTFDGKTIHNKLNGLKKGQTWQLYEGETLKYAIKKNYTGALAKCGQMISVKLPFSDIMYEEPLANIDELIREGERSGLAIEQYSNMFTYFEKFKTADRGLYDLLSEADIEYIKLHSFVTMRKIK